MTIKWESNSRVKSLASIKAEDIIPRTTTMQFPAKTATVRLHKVRDKHPHVTIHFKGKSQLKTRSYWDWHSQSQKTHTWDMAETMRFNFKLGDDSFNMNGEMNFADLDEIMSTVNEVKDALDGK